MSEAPERHPGLPAAAVWVEDFERWEEVARDTAGAKDGPCRIFRADGSLFMSCHFAGGVQDGEFAVYHRDGRIARQGRYSQGDLHGGIVAFATDAEDDEPLRSCCVPPNSRQMRSEYQRGQLQWEHFFDAEGKLLLSDGTRRPEIPAGLPATAEYDEGSRRWSIPADPGTPAGLWRHYTQDGRLDEESRVADSWKVFSRLYAQDGSVKEESTLHHGRRQGPQCRRFIEGVESPYLDARIAEERGEMLEDRPVGRWTFLDAAGQVVRVAERGQPLPVDGLADPVFSGDERSAESWAELADRLSSDGQTALGLCAAARAAARQGEVDDLIAFIARHVVALRGEPAIKLAEQAAAAEGEPIRVLLLALVAGAEPAAIYRSLASAQRESPRAGLDFVEVSLRLAPDRRMTHLTRALLRLELGDERGALADADRVEELSPESASFVRAYAHLLMPEWAFWPARGHLEQVTAVEGMPDEPGQPLEAIQRTMAVYATRLAQLRSAARALLPARRSPPAWLPPDVSALLPAGPVALRRFDSVITDETDEGPDTITVKIDETLDTTRAGLPAIMRVARAQWAALTWLCWCCGLDRVALPSAIAPPAQFPLAAAAGLTRLFRAHDTLATGGLRSRTAGVPAFLWQEMDIDEMPRPFVQIAVDECYEVRALFLWLLSPENLSPFQSDLRDVG